jgi:RNA polymerase-binding protein DksA
VSSRAAAKKASASKTVTKTVAKKAPAKKAATKTVAKKAPAKKAATKTAVKKAPAKKAATKKAATKKAAATTSAKETATKTAASKPAATKTTTKTVAKKAPVKKAAAKKTSAAPGKLAVKADEKPWTKKELDQVRGELMADRERLRSELNMAEHELHDLMRDAGDGAGNDQADVGSTTFERDHEMSLANNARDMLAQTERALLRIEAGTYGICESCGEPIGKMRLMAFPRATLCLSCKQREERR